MSQETDPTSANELLSIAEVERQTGIRPATLRMWEKRYGFPQPMRDRHGDRAYPPSQVERLQAARRFLDQGLRPGKILSGGAGLDALIAAAPGPASSSSSSPGPCQPILDLLRDYRIAELHSHFQLRLLDLGLRRFVIDYLAPLSAEVGRAWARGELPVRSEHLFSQLAMSILQARQAGIRAAGRPGPKVILATITGEAHMLGILMAEAVLTTHGVECIQLGSDLPPMEIAAAARETCAEIVALSLSSWFPRKSAVRMIRELRAALPPATVLWVGGDGAPGAAALTAGVYVFDTLAAIEPALVVWRSRVAA